MTADREMATTVMTITGDAQTTEDTIAPAAMIAGMMETVDTAVLITTGDLRIMHTIQAGDILTCLRETGIIIHCHLLISV
jgi:hypothetical protein